MANQVEVATKESRRSEPESPSVLLSHLVLQARYSGDLKEVQSMVEGDFGTDFNNFPEKLSGNAQLMEQLKQLLAVQSVLLEVLTNSTTAGHRNNPHSHCSQQFYPAAVDRRR